jgi:hypothetical protein
MGAHMRWIAATLALACLVWSGLGIGKGKESLTVLAAGSATESLVGTWKLASRVSRLADGKVVADPALGATPSGVLIYDANGHVAAQLSRQGRTMDIFRDECAEISALKTSPNTANTVFGYDAYFGTYTVHEKEGFVTHHLESALWPGNLGKDINRSFKLDGDTLTITFTTIQDEQKVTRTLVWHRWK